MYIEDSGRYYQGGDQCTRAARFLILVGLGLERTEVTCDRCSGFGRYIDGDDIDDATIRPCYYCIQIRCQLCDGKGWTYDKAKDERAKTCETCKGKGDLGPSGKMVKYIHHKEIRALVRRVALHQCGHFMMGSARAFGHTIPISGSYGGDGLTCDVPREVFDRAVPIPPKLHEAWSNKNSWNGAGSEAPAMRAWALANLDKLEGTKRKAR